MATWAVYINDREMTPYNLDKVKITEFKEEYMRVHKKISSPLYFINSPIDDKYDYDYIIGLSFDDKHTVRITKNGVTKYTGEFNKTAIKVSRDDIGERMVSLTPDAIDEYTVIHEGEDIEANVINTDSKIVRGQLKSYLVFTGYKYNWFLMHPEFPEESMVDWDSYYEVHSAISPTETESIRIYASERVLVSSSTDLSGSGWTELDDYGGFKLWGRVPVDYEIPGGSEEAMPTIFLPTGIGEMDGHYLIVTPKEWILDDGSYTMKEGSLSVYTPFDIYNGGQYLNMYSYYVAYSLKSCLDKILSEVMPNFTGEAKSTELFGTIEDLYLIDKSDFKNPFSSNDDPENSAVEIATKSITTFKKLIEDIKTLIKGTWYIDESGDLRIEKISDRVLGDGADISSYITSKDDYEYINDEIPNRIIFSPTEAWSEDFTQKEIVYGNIPVLQGVKEQKQEISFSTLTTDFDGANQHLDQLSDDGFILIETSTIYSSNGDINIVSRDTGKYTNETQIQNANLSIANILYNYYRHEAYKQTFTMNGVETEALSLKKLKVQPAVVAILPQPPDIEELITTLEGEGEIETIEESCTDENLYTMRILYPH